MKEPQKAVLFSACRVFESRSGSAPKGLIHMGRRLFLPPARYGAPDKASGAGAAAGGCWGVSASSEIAGTAAVIVGFLTVVDEVVGAVVRGIECLAESELFRDRASNFSM